MKKLYSHFRSLSLILLCSAGAAQGMELTISEQQTPVVREIPSLKEQCLDYIEQNAQQVDLLNNLADLPTDLAVEAILSIDSTYLDQNETELIQLAQSNTLDTSIVCAIAQRSEDMALAYELAKSGPITDGVASAIVRNFFNTDVITCLTDFENKFNELFPQDILKHNYNNFYRALINEINHVRIKDWVENDNQLFSIQDFEQNLSVEEIVQCTVKKHFFNENFDKACKNGVVALSPCKNLLAFCEKDSDGFYMVIEIHNLKSRNKISFTSHLMNLSKGLDKPKIVFSKDSSCFGMLDKDGNIYSTEIALTMNSMLFKDVSLSKIGSLVYCLKQVRQKYYYLMLKDIIFESSMDSKEKMLFDYIHFMDMEAFPPCAIKELEQWSMRFQGAYTLIHTLEIASKELNMTKKELLTKYLIEEDPQLRQELDRMIDNLEDNIRLNLMAAIPIFFNDVLIRMLITGR